MTVSSTILLAYKRQEISEVILEVGEKYLHLAKISEDFAKKVRDTYMIEFQLLAFVLAGGFAMGYTQPMYMLVSGNLFYDTALPLSTESYSWQWWLQMIYQGSIPILSGIVYSCKEFLLVAPHFYLSMMFNHHSQTIAKLYTTEGLDNDQEYKKLVGVARESCQLLG